VLAFNALMTFAVYGAMFALFAAAIGLVGFVLWRIVRGLARLVGLAERPDPRPSLSRQNPRRPKASQSLRASARR
jgi:hypothetical protein